MSLAEARNSRAWDPDNLLWREGEGRRGAEAGFICMIDQHDGPEAAGFICMHLAFCQGRETFLGKAIELTAMVPSRSDCFFPLLGSACVACFLAFIFLLFLWFAFLLLSFSLCCTQVQCDRLTWQTALL